jgi:hypothetical protein
MEKQWLGLKIARKMSGIGAVFSSNSKIYLTYKRKTASNRPQDVSRCRFIALIADYAVSKNNTDYEIGISIVTLSRSEGSVAMGTEMLRCGSA